MSHHAHGTQYSRGCATKKPLARVRTVQEKRKPLGWLECSADEFVRLLALHDAGKINLLTMPEYSTDDPEKAEEVEGEQAPQPAPRSQSGVTIERNYAGAGMVRQLLARAAAPMTIVEIAHKLGLSVNAVRKIVRSDKEHFVCVGVDGHTKRWKATKREDICNGISQ